MEVLTSASPDRRARRSEENCAPEIAEGSKPVDTQTYAYPGGSNRLSGVGQGGTAVRSFLYDAAGNLTGDTRAGTAYAYAISDAGRIAQVTVGGVVKANYLYDGKNRLSVRQVVNSTPSGTQHLIHDVWDHVLAETDGAGQAVREYVWAGDIPVAVVDSSAGAGSPTLLWVHVDHLGRPELMTDATKAVKWRAVYEPFGAVSSLTGPAALSMRFPGQWFQLEAGLAYNWNRHYDATTGRYTQPDPLGLNQGPQISALATPRQSGFLLQSAFGLESSTDIAEAVGAAELNLRVTGDGVSLYGYVRQSPVMWTDPTGLNPTAIVPAVCMINPGLCAGAAAAAAGVIGKICEPLFSKKSGKERATDIPSWAKGQKPNPGESGRDFADRVMDARYGKGNYPKGPGSEYNQIRKYGDRSR
ncbi:RHS protein [Methylobacterium sp. 4-46]|uniref:RHS repeat domain-containing protein n=1 Tax=unclassified Methylobacterium TaxID=2615210 RepID=UPI000152E17E|nr:MULTISPECIES: RHS repeat-associated core domain-containing protein [Methylobacterium]ACA16903.1 RHS protein [Methylobacterium sp. 4-46]WFT82592.1 RHS repeat-associated core domain-containing protein [Methylobacterium nodulans]